MMRALLASVALLAAAALPALSCTAVDIMAADKSVVAGRTMEWAFDMKWKLVSVPKGAKLRRSPPAKRRSISPAREIETLYPLVGIAAGIIPWRSAAGRPELRGPWE